MVMRYVYLSRDERVPMPAPFAGPYDYPTLDSYYNRSRYARELPPVPRDCPRPMGVLGPMRLPEPQVVVERVFRRRHFKPCPRGSNLFLATWAQHFTHQFFKTEYSRGPDFTFGNNEGVDGSNLYGQSEETRRLLRSLQDGKLRVQWVGGEDVPPMLQDVPGVQMSYPKGNTPQEKMEPPLLRRDGPVAPMWALGHPTFSMTPMLFVLQTIWLREHNRLCDLLKRDHPDWDDERLYQTARIINTGLMVQVTTSDYVTHLGQYKLALSYEPYLVHGTRFQFVNRIKYEFVLLYHWHNMVPDVVRVDGERYTISDLLFTNNSVVFKHGFNRFLNAMFYNAAGMLTARNHGMALEPVVRRLVEHMREVRMQPFNNYRRQVSMAPYRSFLELTGDPDLAKDLEALYEDVDAVEFFVGLLSEKHDFSVTPPTMVSLGGSWAVRGLAANPIGSPTFWKPSTFGGEEYMQIILNTTLRDLVCRNLRGAGCEGMHISFRVPEPVYEAAMRHAKRPFSSQFTAASSPCSPP